ncbi:Diphthamide biosynthesis protein 4 [Exophiala dermatitidis]
MSNTNTPRARGKQYTHYDVLSLSRHPTRNSLPKDEIKAAYRRALLLHHPDKISQSGRASKASTTARPTPLYSVDEIVVAYEVLADPERRAAYDRALIQEEESEGCDRGTHTGVESYDLEDLPYDETQNIWYRHCRCGDERGYILTEADLEKESEQREVYVGCRGCSLFIKVLFELAET